MFSMAFPPDYATSGLLYVFYTRDISPGTHDVVIREFQRTGNANDIDESTARDVLVTHPTPTTTTAASSSSAPTGTSTSRPATGAAPLRTASPDHAAWEAAPHRSGDPPGAPAYSIPAGNPFADGAGNADEIYSYGLRNPYRFSFDRFTGDLIIADVGQGEWEEIDFVSNGLGRGANFGWRCFEGRRPSSPPGECSPPPSNHTPPVHQYPNPPAGGAAINGGYVVRDTTLPSLLGRYLYADSVGAFPEIRSINLFAGGSSGDASTGLTGGTSSFGEDACGHVYVAHFSGAGQPDPAAPAAPSPALRSSPSHRQPLPATGRALP